MSAQRRLLRDLNAIDEKECGFIASPVDSNLLLWTAAIVGPEDTIWEGGLFTLRLSFTEKYPI